jgi:hypothetical protein
MSTDSLTCSVHAYRYNTPISYVARRKSTDSQIHLLFLPLSARTDPSATCDLAVVGCLFLVGGDLSVHCVRAVCLFVRILRARLVAKNLAK